MIYRDQEGLFVLPTRAAFKKMLFWRSIPPLTFLVGVLDDTLIYLIVPFNKPLILSS